MNFENSVKNLIKLLIFAFFIAMPFIYFCIQIYDLYNDGNVGKFILLINTFFLPLEVLINAALNIAGFCILKKDKNWSRFALVYLFIQSVVSVMAAVLQIRIEMILMCLFNVFSFFVAVAVHHSGKTGAAENPENLSHMQGNIAGTADTADIFDTADLAEIAEIADMLEMADRKNKEDFFV